MSIKFIAPNPSQHWYTQDGRPRFDVDLRVARKEFLYTSVSTVIKIFPAPALEIYKQNQLLQSCLTLSRLRGEDDSSFAKRAVLDSRKHAQDAANWGTGMHKAMENYEKGQPIADFYLPWMPYYAAYRDEEVDTVVASEITCIDHDTRTAGTSDSVYRNILGELCFSDYKTKHIDEGDKAPFGMEMCIQLAGYRMGYAKANNITHDLPRCRSVIINRRIPEPFYVKEWTEEELVWGYEAFKRLAWLWYFSKKYFPGGKEHFLCAI